MKPFFILLLSAFTLSVSAQKHAPSRFAGLDTAFARVLKTWKAPGFAVAVVEKNKVVYSKGFGYADYEARIPATPNTVFAIASCTKAFTAGLLGILNNEGIVDFDKPVRTYLSSLSFYNNEMNNGVTLRDMMCHRTGLPRHDVSWSFFPTDNRDSLLQRIQYLKPSAELRQRYQYSNLMYMALGAVSEKITGKSWEENIRSSFFEPLHMTRSTDSYADWMKTDSIAKGYDLKKDSLISSLDYRKLSSIAPCGGISSSVNDMAKWVMTWINGGKYNGKEILPAVYVAEAMSSQVVMDGTPPASDNKDILFSTYGFGWSMDAYHGHYRVEHSGGIDGFTSDITFFPTDSIGIVVLCNQNGSGAPFVVRDLIADKILRLPYTDWNDKLRGQYEKEAALAKQTDTTAANPATHPLADYVGVYLNKGYGKIDLRLLGDSLIATNMFRPVYYRHKNYDVFDAVVLEKDGYDTANVMPTHFLVDDQGEINSLSVSLEPSVDPIVFERVPEEKPVSKESLKKYTGDYIVSPAFTAKVYIKMDSVLYLLVSGEPEYELLPAEENKFRIRNLSGYSLQFNTDAGGKVTELLFVQPNGTFKAVKKESSNK